jgi:hypothetical protein
LSTLANDDAMKVACPKILRERFRSNEMRSVSKSGRRTIPKCRVSLKKCSSQTIGSKVDNAVEYAFNYFNRRCISIDQYTGISGLERRYTCAPDQMDYDSDQTHVSDDAQGEPMES